MRYYALNWLMRPTGNVRVPHAIEGELVQKQTVRDQNVGYAIYPVTNTVIILVNILVFLYEVTLQPLQLNDFFQAWGAIPAEIAQFQHPITLLTSMFIHGSWAHLIGNMAFLKLFGDNIEDAMGHWSYLSFYLLCGFAATAAQTLIDTTSTIPAVGASGAIAGVMGAYIVLFPKGQLQIAPRSPLGGRGKTLPAAVMIGLWFASQLINGIASLGGTASFGGGIAFWAHVGGFVAGALLVWLFKDQTSVDRQRAEQEAQAAQPVAVRSQPTMGRRRPF
jgi:membrane associated rhomboid family serine protease